MSGLTKLISEKKITEGIGYTFKYARKTQKREKKVRINVTDWMEN